MRAGDEPADLGQRADRGALAGLLGEARPPPRPSGPSSPRRTRIRRARSSSPARSGLLRRAPVACRRRRRRSPSRTGRPRARAASRALARSLSMTTSAPTSVRVPGSYIVGMPPPPVQITTAPCSSSQRIGRISKIRFGSGEATTRRHLSPSGLIGPALLGGQLVGLGLVVDRADELGRVLERGIVRVDLDHRQERRERPLDRQQVAQLLLDHVADHPLGLGAEDVERVRLDGRVRGALEGQQPDLRAVAVGDDELVARPRSARAATAAVADVRRAGSRRSSAGRAGAARCRPARRRCASAALPSRPSWRRGPP